jgi:MoaA/NifB/PqqE/SkfB family radical SAM enzyme
MQGLGEPPEDKPKTFCPVPWSYLFTATNGEYKSCVAAYSSSSGGQILDEQGGALNAAKHSVDQARTSPILNKLRQNMLRGEETPEVCERCISEESHQLVSRRKIENEHNYFSFEQARAITQPDGHLAELPPLRVLDIKMGNLCNLSCRMCGPSQSTGWYEEWHNSRFKNFHDGQQRLELSELTPGRVELIDNPYRWYENPDFWDDCLKQAESIKEIHFSGGEPLLAAQHLKILEHLNKQGVSQNIRLTYNTNLTVLPKHVVTLWKNFKSVRLGVSVDGPAQVNDYIRYPSRFEKIHENLATLDQMPNKIIFWLTTTISILNIRSYPQLIHWLLTCGLKRVNRDFEHNRPPFFLSLHLLRQPEELALSSLPSSAKELIQDEYDRFIKSIASNYPQLSFEETEHIKAQLNAIIAAMNKKSSSGNLYRFWIETMKSDSYRKQSFYEVEPDIALIIETHLKQTGQWEAATAMAQKRWW